MFWIETLVLSFAVNHKVTWYPHSAVGFPQSAGFSYNKNPNVYFLCPSLSLSTNISLRCLFFISIVAFNADTARIIRVAVQLVPAACCVMLDATSENCLCDCTPGNCQPPADHRVRQIPAALIHPGRFMKHLQVTKIWVAVQGNASFLTLKVG